MQIITESKILLRQVVVKNYPSSIKVANKIAPKYYVHPTSKKRGKIVNNKSQLPLKYQTDDYVFDKNGYLVNKVTGEKPLVNPIKTGQERWWVVNFQDIWNQNVAQQARNMRTILLKSILEPHLKTIQPFNDEDYPLELNLFICDHKMPIDISNKGVVYTKVIEDSLKELGIIPDDKVQYINCSGRTKFIKIDEDREPMMIIRIFKSSNKLLSNDK